MKKIILLMLTLMTTLCSMAQLEEKQKSEWQIIGELKWVATTRAKLQYSTSGKDTSYLLLLSDSRPELKNNYFTILFKGTDNTFSKFYQLLKSFFEKENKKNKEYDRTFRLGDSMVHVQHYRKITVSGIMLTTKEGFIILSEKDIDKLFGMK